MLLKLKKNFFLLISIFLMIYFFVNLLGGERGLFSYFKKKDILKNLKNEEILLTNKINNINFKNSLLSDNLDIDYIEILIRQNFLFGKKNEKLYIIKKK